jgi:putative phosphotransacetylase
LGLADGDWIRVACGAGSRRVVFEDLLVRAGPTHATEVHLDTDEAAAADVTTGGVAEIVGIRRGRGG